MYIAVPVLFHFSIAFFVQQCLNSARLGAPDRWSAVGPLVRVPRNRSKSKLVWLGTTHSNNYRGLTPLFARLLYTKHSRGCHTQEWEGVHRHYVPA